MGKGPGRSKTSIWHRRPLAADNPARFEPDLAESLNTLSVGLAAAGEQPAALDAIREAVRLLRPYADASLQESEFSKQFQVMEETLHRLEKSP